MSAGYDGKINSLSPTDADKLVPIPTNGETESIVHIVGSPTSTTGASGAYYARVSDGSYRPIGTGAAGSTGATGATGATGSTGATGGTGAGLAVVGEFFTQNVNAGAPVAAGAAFPLFTNSSNNTAGAFTHASPSGNVTVNTTGLYDVEFDATFAEAGAITVYLDGVPVIGANRGRATGTNGCVGSSLISITSGQVISLRANSGNAAALTITGTGSIGTTDTTCIVTSLKMLKVN